MPIIGTAGHVDHGKSTLVQALTGRDPDRWAEEKERGLTIDLGFAWTTLSGTAVGFVDVPGHERFIKNMLAGVSGFDVALFVVAADEGWMPQSAEHLTVLDLLGVRRGVIALTRVDLADPELIELSRAEVADHVESTVAASWPVVEVAAPTGAGLDQVVAALTAELSIAGPSPDVGHPKMWIDRVFTISGAGVVATGTLIDGSFSVGDALECYPGGDVRIRGLQSHEATHDTIGPGNRVAVNLVGADRDDLGRGTLLAAPGSMTTTRRFLAALATAHRTDADITDRGAYHVHLGTATIPSRIRIIGDEGAGIAIITTDSPVPVAMGDRFILRDTGRRIVAGGGTVLDPMTVKRPSPEDAAVLASAVDLDPSSRANALVSVHGAIDEEELLRSSGGGTPSDAISVGSMWYSPDALAAKGRTLVSAVDEYHERYPLRPGLPKSEAASRLHADSGLVTSLVTADNDLLEDGPSIRRFNFEPLLGPADEAVWKEAETVLDADLAVPRVSDLGLPDEVLHALIRRGDLVRIAGDLVYLPAQIDTVTSSLGSLPNEFTVAMFRDTFGLSRRQAVPLLEWLDAEGWTRRRGDGRTVRPGRGSSAGGVPSR